MRQPDSVIYSKRHGTYSKRWKHIWKSWLLFVSHEFLSPDEDEPHNHHGPSITFVRSGRGLEYTWDSEGKFIGCRYLTRGSIVIRGTKNYHKISIAPGEKMHTWFALIPTKKKWGFLTDKGHVDSNVYKLRTNTDKYFGKRK